VASTMRPLTASDTVTLAMERTKRMLFRPFRFSLYWRMAVLAIFTGEISGGGLPNLNFRTGIDHPSIPAEIRKYIGVFVAVAVLVAILYFVFLYITSVLHFVLFEAVLTGTTRIRDGWRRWRGRGRSYFGFNLLLVVAWLAIATAIGVPAYFLHRIGVFSTSHLALAILVGAVLASFALVLLLALTLVAIMTKDFVVPIMMLEDVNVADAWRRAWPMIKAEGKRYAGFYGLKIVLRIAASIILSIMLVLLAIVLAIPIIILAVLAVPGMKSASAGTGLLALVIALGVLVLVSVVMIALAVLGAPIAVFFISYTLQFFGSRYEPLRLLVYPEPPPMPPPLVPVIPPLAPVPPPVGA
jgi:hypothetical protein